MRGKLMVLVVGLAASLFSAQAQQNPVDHIEKEVRHEILMLPYFSVFDNLTFRVSGGTVTLMGQVTNPTLKGQVGNVVKNIEGVQNVVNKIEVLPASTIDDQLRMRLYRDIYGYPALEKYAISVVKPIRIIVNMGRVSLEGVVDNEADKNMAGLRANGVSGVFSVTNNLVVVPPK